MNAIIEDMVFDEIEKLKRIAIGWQVWSDIDYQANEMGEHAADSERARMWLFQLIDLKASM